jgi:transcription elongation factor Elf1
MPSAIAERKLSCPFCGERISVVLDLSGGGQSYVEDCQVCCQPMQLSFDVNDGEITNLQVACAV